MPIQFTCSCGQTSMVEDQYAGAQVQCPYCQVVLVVPTPQDNALPYITDQHLAQQPVAAQPQPSYGIPATSRTQHRRTNKGWLIGGIVGGSVLGLLLIILIVMAISGGGGQGGWFGSTVKIPDDWERVETRDGKFEYYLPPRSQLGLQIYGNLKTAAASLEREGNKRIPFQTRISVSQLTLPQGSTESLDSILRKTPHGLLKMNPTLMEVHNTTSCRVAGYYGKELRGERKGAFGLPSSPFIARIIKIENEVIEIRCSSLTPGQPLDYETLNIISASFKELNQAD